MVWDEALKSALEVLEEEQMRPTVNYRDTGTLMAGSGSVRFPPNQRILEAQRAHPTREVNDDPKQFQFVSSNFDLLAKLYSQLSAPQRTEFIAALEPLVPAGASGSVPRPRFPTWKSRMSSLPLLLEFLVRMGHTEALVRALKQTQVTNVGVLLMLWQLGETISFNFTLFSNQELVDIPEALSNLESVTAEKLRGKGSGIQVAPGGSVRSLGPPPAPTTESETLKIISGLRAECKQARFHYLSGFLQELPNLEVDADKGKVEHYLKSLGFSEGLVNALNKAETEYASASTLFDLKNCLGHLRSVVEHLHLEACRAIAAATLGLVAPDSFGNALVFLRKNGYLSSQEEALIGGLYKVLSDQGVHPLFSEREYARLLRNMTIEYGLLFLTVLDKKAIHIS